jgi:hypothetical protein
MDYDPKGSQTCWESMEDMSGQCKLLSWYT